MAYWSLMGNSGTLGAMPVLIDDPLDSGLATASSSNSPPRADDYPNPVREIGGPPGPEPTRYGDWEQRGRCIDF
jgi:hypothetical protein